MAFQMPESLPPTVAELDTLLDSAKADIRVIQARHAAGEELTREDTDRLKGLVADSKTITTARDEAAADEAKNAEELKDLLAEAEGAVAAGTEITDDQAAKSDEADADKAKAGGPEGDDEGEENGSEGGDAADQADPIAAGGAPKPPKKSASFAGVGDGKQPPTGDDAGTPGWQMHPNAPGYAEGQGKVGFADIALALDKVRPGSRAVRPNRPNKRIDGRDFGVQVISTLQRDVQVVDDAHALVAAISKATSVVKGQRVSTKSLTAAGGWCAPSEQLYDFCDVPEASDLVSLPEITINRGGIRWPQEPDLSGIFEDFEWFFTETELEAVDGQGNPTAIKQCVEIPCADEFNEIRLNAVGWCVEAGILQEQGWPELVEWFMRALTQEHLRALSRRTILNVVAGSGDALVIPPTSVMGSVASVLNSLALMATNLRLKRGYGRSYPIEGIAPSWFFEVLRADLAFREGTDTFAITDDQITGWLSSRNIVLQFVGDWQTRSTGLPGNLLTLQWPGTVDIVLYPAGTWFRSMSNVIELGVMYPKEQLQVNRFTRMFTEDAIAVGKRCGESVLTRIPLETNGAIGARETITINPGSKTNSLATSGVPTGGTVDLVFSSGHTAAGIAFGATAAQVKTALVAMDDDFTASDFTTAGGALPTAVSITYPAELGTLTVVSHLTGGTAPAATIS